MPLELAMTARTTSRRTSLGESTLFNWLNWLDEEVQRFPREANWLQHPPFQFARCRLFMTVRYLELQRPLVDELLCRELSRGEQRILEHQDGGNIVKGLKDQQRKQLAALFLDIVNSLENYSAHRRRASRVHKLADETPRRKRMLASKLAKASRALEDLHKYAASLDEVLGWQHVRATKICLKRLRRLKEEAYPEFHQSIKAEYPSLENPVTLGMVQLYWFLRHGCGLSGDQAEIQVARIRNAFWTDYGVPKVNYRPEYQTGESKGCDCVHLAVQRFKGTSCRKTP
jgi:hypothetical protein